MSNRKDPLQPLLSDIADKIGRARNDLEQIRGSVKKIRETVEQAVEDLHDAVYDGIEAQAELKMMERMAEVQSIPPQIEAEEERISQEREEIDEKIETVSQRYESRHEELNRKATDRVRDLGSHIFEVLEDDFEEGIETPFVEAIPPTWRELQEHNASVAANRSTRLHDRLAETTEEIDAFLDRRAALLDDIHDQRVELDISIGEPRTFQIPFWVVTIDRDGTEETRVIAPSYVSDGKEDWFTADIEEAVEFNGLFEQLGRTTSSRTGSIDVTPTELVSGVEPYAEEGVGGSLNFATEFRRTLSAEPEIHIEGE